MSAEQKPMLRPSGPLGEAMLSVSGVPTLTIVVGLDVSDQPAVATAIDLAESFGGEAYAVWRGGPGIPTLNLFVRIQLGLAGLDPCEFLVAFDPTQQYTELASMAKSGCVAFAAAPLGDAGQVQRLVVVRFDGPGLAAVLTRRGRTR